MYPAVFFFQTSGSLQVYKTAAQRDAAFQSQIRWQVVMSRTACYSSQTGSARLNNDHAQMQYLTISPMLTLSGKHMFAGPNELLHLQLSTAYIQHLVLRASH